MNSSTVKPLARIEPNAAVRHALMQKTQFTVALSGLASLGILLFMREVQPSLVVALAFLLALRATQLFRTFQPVLDQWGQELTSMAISLSGQYIRLHETSRLAGAPGLDGVEYILTFLTGENRLHSFPCLVPGIGEGPVTEYFQVSLAEYRIDGRLALLHGTFR